MDAIQAIMTRRSVRNYETDKPISDEAIKTLLSAAMNAPSAGNQQPWFFIVFDDLLIKQEIVNDHPYAHMLKKAPLGILVCENKKNEKYSDSGVLDCSAATQNILIAANALGIGSVWVGVYPEEDRIRNMRRIFHLPDHIVPISIVALGYANKAGKEIVRYSEDRIFYNVWEQTKDNNDKGI